jgi:transcription-repair coupling factor (superfamily II helicase)
VALRDLEIRGAGNLLGAQQSGHIETVGYETYQELIAEAVAELRGRPAEHRYLPPFDVTTDASIPNDYIELESQKITLYKRITAVHTVADVDDLQAELKDRFGDPPRPVRRLLDVMRARALGGEAGATKLAATRDTLTITFPVDHEFASAQINSLRATYGDRLGIVRAKAAALVLALNGDDAIETAGALLIELGVERRTD